MYSALEGVDEVVESFSQSLSSFRLPVEGHEEKPSAESGLLAEMNKPKKKKMKRADRHRNTDRYGGMHTQDAHTHAVEQGQTLPVVAH